MKLIFIAALCVTCITAAHIPKLKMKILEYTTKVTSDNIYFGPWTSEIIANGEAVNAKTPIKKQLPDDMRVQVEIKFITNDGIIIVSEDITVCEYFEKYITNANRDFLVPKDKYPTQCPITACEECEIINMTLPVKEMPPDFPAAIIESHSIVYINDSNAPILDSFAKMRTYYE